MAETASLLGKQISGFFINVVCFLFRPEAKRLSKWVERLWLLGLYLGGAVVWSFFLNLGNLGFDLHDWTQEGPRYAFLRESLIENRLPLHIGSPLAATDRFFAIPDIVVSPQVVLLRFLEPGLFVLVNTLFLYSLGVIGLLMLRRKFAWSPMTFAVVFLLFNLNGHPIAHIAVGHSMWASYFLLPYFMLLTLSLLEGSAGWKWVTQMALLQLGLFLQGGFHFVIWSMMFLLFLGVFSSHYLLDVLKALVFSLLLCLVRILPVALEFSAKKNPFISGYFSVSDMLDAFITLKLPAEAQLGKYSALGWWEVDIYTGLLGLAFVIYFGLYRTLKDQIGNDKPLRDLLAPIFAMTILSIGKIFQPINMLPIPLIDAERVASRFLIIPLVLTLILAGIQFERFLRKTSMGFGLQLFFMTVAGVMGHDLLQHARLWRVENMETLFTRTPVDIRAQIILRPDPPYVTALLVGLGISMSTLAFLIFKVYQERRTTS